MPGAGSDELMDVDVEEDTKSRDFADIVKMTSAAAIPNSVPSDPQQRQAQRDMHLSQNQQRQRQMAMGNGMQQ